ncbi:MAG: hypothetical protein FWE76_08205 [Symbiobacteriaceae bacterium]|nr:hypothetical protein [Symbiobacteriaceae bacterium]
MAAELSGNNDLAGIREVVDGFTGTDKAIANDCIKVLSEVGKQKPELISEFVNEFIIRLRSRNNRLAWGSMMALATIVDLAPQAIFKRLSVVIAAYEVGSVITVDNSISVFAGLCKADESYALAVLPLLINHLQNCKPKEVPQHAERASVCFTRENAGTFIEVLEVRLPYLSKPGKVRVEKLLKKLYMLREPR